MPPRGQEMMRWTGTVPQSFTKQRARVTPEDQMETVEDKGPRGMETKAAARRAIRAAVVEEDDRREAISAPADKALGSNQWHSSSWKQEGHVDLATLRIMVCQLAKLCLRHEDSVNMWRAESSLVLFVRTGIPGSLVPSLFSAKSEWLKMKEEAPDKVRRPMRNILFSCLVREMHDRLVTLKNDAERRKSMERLGWLQGENFQRLKWDPKLKKNVRDDEASVLSYEDVLAVQQSIMTRCNTVEALLRFHPTRPITDQMPEGTVAFLLQFFVAK